MAKRGKRYAQAIAKVDRSVYYDGSEALGLVVDTASAKFDETVEAHIKLGVDSRHADQQVRGAIVLPHGTGKTKKVLVFAKGEKAKEAEAAGADFAKAIDEIKAGKVEYRLDKTNIIHVPVGKASFGQEKLFNNFKVLMEAIIKAKPSAAKGQYLRSVTVASSMGPGVRVNPVRVTE